MEIGAHVSIAGGYIEAFKRARDIGGNAMQIFTKSPRGGPLRKVSDEEALEIREWQDRKKIEFSVIHSSYVLNFAKPLPADAYEARSLLDDLESADKIGAYGVVVHVGKTLDRDPVEAENLFVQNIASILERSKNLNAHVIIENTAGQGSELGYRFDHLGKIIHAIKKEARKRISVCLDTAHTFAAGYDLSTKNGVREALHDFDTYIGFENLIVTHFNDSKKPCGSRVDRHEDIGRGTIGQDGLKYFLKSLYKEKRVPLILETPESFDPFTKQITAVRDWI